MNPEQAGQSPASGRYPHAAAPPGLLGAVGGMIGSAVSSAAQMPLALLETGQQLAQAATQGLSAWRHGCQWDRPAATDLAAASDVSHGTGGPGGPTRAARQPAGATNTTPVGPRPRPRRQPTTPPQGAPQPWPPLPSARARSRWECRWECSHRRRLPTLAGKWPPTRDRRSGRAAHRTVDRSDHARPARQSPTDQRRGPVTGFDDLDDREGPATASPNSRRPSPN